MPSSIPLRERMRRFYETSEIYRGFLEDHDEAYLAAYVNTVLRYARPGDQVLEMGCGNGLSAYLIAEHGFRVTGTDISSLFLADSRSHPNAQYQVADALDLPFPDATFDLVCSNELVEHVPDAEKSLSEMLRVTAPGGRILVSGPNLCSPVMPLLDLPGLLLGRSGREVWAETPLQALSMAWRNFRVSFDKRFAPEPQFLYRDPDLEDRVIGGDADSVYLASPIDLERFFRGHGCQIVKLSVGHGFRGRILAMLTPRLSPYISMVVQKI